MARINRIKISPDIKILGLDGYRGQWEHRIISGPGLISSRLILPCI